MDDTLVIKSVAVGAAESLAALHRRIFDDSWDAGFITSMMHLPGTIAFIATGDTAALGFVLARALGGEAEVLTIGVAPEAQNQGVGSALLKSALAAAAALGARAMHLEVAVSNDAARALYERAGFEHVGRRPRYYDDGSDALLFRKSLDVVGL